MSPSRGLLRDCKTSPSLREAVPVSVHHPVEEGVEAVVEAGEGPEQLLEPEVELLGAGLVRPPPDGHHVVRGPAQREPQHQHAHDLHSLHLQREFFNFIDTHCDQSLTFARPMTPELTHEFRMVRFNLLDRLSNVKSLSTFHLTYLISDNDFFSAFNRYIAEKKISIHQKF